MRRASAGRKMAQRRAIQILKIDDRNTIKTQCRASESRDAQTWADALPQGAGRRREKDSGNSDAVYACWPEPESIQVASRTREGVMLDSIGISRASRLQVCRVLTQRTPQPVTLARLGSAPTPI